MAKAFDDLTLTTDEFLRFEGEPQARYELVEGRLVMMAPTLDAHGTIAVNLATEIDRQLGDGSPCRVQNERGIRVSDTSFYVADVVLNCAPPDREPHAASPVLIVEVLSASTAAFDRSRKLDDYKSLATVQEIWLVDSERRWAQVWVREEGRWTGRDFVGSASFTSPTLGNGIALDRLYRKTILAV